MNLVAWILRNTMYKEKTNVLSYYVIKTILINSYQSFLYWCKTNNDSLLQFKQTVDNKNKYCAFIEKNYKSASMIEGVYEAERTIIKSKNDLYLLDNMRMSICEVGWTTKLIFCAFPLTRITVFCRRTTNVCKTSITYTFFVSSPRFARAIKVDVDD